MSEVAGQFKRFEPPKIEVTGNTQASDFVQKTGDYDSDFQLSDLVAQQSGVAQLQKQKMQKEVQDQVNVKLAEIQQQAQKEGYEKGLEEGKARAYADFSKSLEEKAISFEKVLQELSTIRESLAAAHEAQLIQLVFKIAKNMALHEISIQPELILELIKDVIKDFQNEDKLQLLVSPDDSEFIETNLKEIAKKFDADARIKVEADTKVQKGGCRITANMSVVDATIETRLQKAWELLAAKIPKVKDERLKSE